MGGDGSKAIIEQKFVFNMAKLRKGVKKPVAAAAGRDRAAMLPVPPLQARTRERVHAMLAEAERMIAAGGVAALSLPQLAERLGVPRAGVYRHFPSAEALLLALAEQYLAQREQLIPAAWGRARSWHTGLRRLVHAAAAYYADRPAARAVLLHWGMSPEVAAAQRATIDRLGRTIRQLFESRAGVPELPREPDPYIIAVEIVTALFALSERRHRQIRPDYVAEACRAAEAYLQARLPRRPDRAAG